MMDILMFENPIVILKMFAMLTRNRIPWNNKRTQIITIEQTNGSTLWAFLNSVKEIWVTWNSHEFGVCRNNWMVGWTKGYGCLALPKGLTPF